MEWHAHARAEVVKRLSSPDTMNVVPDSESAATVLQRHDDMVGTSRVPRRRRARIIMYVRAPSHHKSG